MRKSREVPLTLLAAAALTALASTGCGQKRCVDAQNRILPDSACQAATPTPGVHYVSGGATGGHFGGAVVGGSESGVSRGGFGHGGGEGGGGEGGE